MSAVYLMLWSNASVRGIITEHALHIFCLYDFMQHVLVHDVNGCKSRTYVKKLFKTLCRENAQFMEFKKPLRPAVASTKMKLTPTLANYMLGDRSSVIEVDLEQVAHPHIPSFHPNFMPPYVVVIEG
jgi:hypothetical protein